MTELEEAAREFQAKQYSIWTGKGMAGDLHCTFIAGAQWQAKQSPWISVEERFPDVGISVFVRTTNKKYVLTSMYIPTDCKGNILGPKEWHGSGAFKGSITHWMPIPE